jgi:AraC family transcriptional regulator
VATTIVAEVSPDGAGYRRAVVGSFEVTRLAFPPSFSHGPVEPERGYLVVVLDGAVSKAFARDSATLSRSSVATMPAGATHSSRFGTCGAHILAVRAADADASPLFGTLLDRRTHTQASLSTAIGWRMAGELEARDSSSDLALEGLALELVAAATRASDEQPCGASLWVSAVRDLMHDHVPDQLSLRELAAAVGRHQTHVARVFRREYGLTVAEYSRSLRLEWARAQLTARDVPLVRLAAEAGFADQSHFTRAFRRHTGVTPARYRARARR